MGTARIVLVMVIVFCFSIGAFAQDYPTKPVTVIVPYTAGSATDVIARALSQKLSELWDQPVTVENRVGTGGITGTDAVAKAPKDGYTILVNSSSFCVYPALYATLPYDPLKDFIEIAPIGKQPAVLVVGQSAGIKSVSGLIAEAKAKPGQLKFGSPGIGTAVHLTAEKFRIAAGVDVVHVPYKGGPEANADTIAGKVTYWFPPVTMAMGAVKEGKLIPLGVTSAKRLGSMPDVPTIAEVAIPGFEDTVWQGVWAPAGIPPGVADKLAKDVARALTAPDLREQLLKIGAEPMSMTPEEFSRLVRSEIEVTARIAKKIGIKPQ